MNADFTDDFNRGNVSDVTTSTRWRSDTPGATWGIVNGTMQVTAAPSEARVLLDTASPTHSLAFGFVENADSTNNFRAMVAYQDSLNHIRLIRVPGYGTWNIESVKNGVVTAYGNVGLVSNVQGIYRLEWDNATTTLSIYTLGNQLNRAIVISDAPSGRSVGFRHSVVGTMSVDNVTVTEPFTTTVQPALGQPTYSTGTTFQLQNGTAFTSVTPTSSNGYGTKTYTIAPAVPAGMTFNTSTGVISGTPTTNQAATNYTVTVTDSAGPAVFTNNRVISIAVQAAIGQPAYSTGNTYQLQVSKAMPAMTVTSANGYGTKTYTVSSGTLPSGLTLNSSTGAISGTPSGTYATASVTVQVRDSAAPANHTQTRTLSFTVQNAIGSPVYSTGTTYQLQNGTAFTSVTPTTANGYGAKGYSNLTDFGTVPVGLSVTSSNGVITGTPTTNRTASNASILVCDSAVPEIHCAAVNLSMAVQSAILMGAYTTQDAGVSGTGVSQQPNSANGYGTKTYSLASGSLPGGVTLNTSTSAITGTPTTVGTFTFTIRVTDSAVPTSFSSISASRTITTVGVAGTPSVRQGCSGATWAAYGDNSCYRVTWTAAGNALGYDLYRSVNGGAYSWFKGITTNTASYDDPHVWQDDTFRYYVVARRNSASAGASGVSAGFVATTGSSFLTRTPCFQSNMDVVGSGGITSTAGTLERGSTLTSYCNYTGLTAGRGVNRWNVSGGYNPLDTGGQLTATRSMSATIRPTANNTGSANRVIFGVRAAASNSFHLNWTSGFSGPGFCWAPAGQAEVCVNNALVATNANHFVASRWVPGVGAYVISYAINTSTTNEAAPLTNFVSNTATAANVDGYGTFSTVGIGGAINSASGSDGTRLWEGAIMDADMYNG
jgi:hypothetical protein